MTLPQGEVLTPLSDRPLSILFPSETLDRLHTLGIRTIGDFVRLPSPGVVRYAGADAGRVHTALRNLGTGDGHRWRRVYRSHPRLRRLLGDPQEAEADSWVWRQRAPDYPLTTVAQMLAVVRPALQQCAAVLQAHHQPAVEVALRLRGEDQDATFSAWPNVPPAQAHELAAVVAGLLDRLVQAQQVPPAISAIAIGVRPGSPPPGRQLRLLGAGTQARQQSEDIQRVLAGIRRRWGQQAVTVGNLDELHTRRRALEVQAQSGPYGIEPQRLCWQGQWQPITVLNRWRYRTRWWRGPDATITVEYFQVLTAQSNALWIVFNHQQHYWSRVKGAGFPGFYDDRLR